jgi:arylamine N-acetyltransferase
MSDFLTRYLALLGLPELAGASPSLVGLARLTRAQVKIVLFENVTAILRRAATGDGDVPPVDSDVLLSSWVAQAGGGVCFDGTPVFRRLLLELGYAARSTTGLITFPGSHQASIVTLDGTEYLVDVANGAPFFEPIAIGQTTVIERAGLAWRFRRTDPETLTQDRRINGEWQPFCHYDLRGPDPVELEAAYQRHQRIGETWVVGGLTLVRCLDDEVIRVRDLELQRFSASGTTAETIYAQDLPQVADEVFGLPNLPIARAWAALQQMQVGAR